MSTHPLRPPTPPTAHLPPPQAEPLHTAFLQLRAALTRQLGPRLKRDYPLAQRAQRAQQTQQPQEQHPSNTHTPQQQQQQCLAVAARRDGPEGRGNTPLQPPQPRARVEHCLADVEVGQLPLLAPGSTLPLTAWVWRAPRAKGAPGGRQVLELALRGVGHSVHSVHSSAQAKVLVTAPAAQAVLREGLLR